MTEANISRSIQKALPALGVRVLRLQSGKVRTATGFVQLCPTGTPDLLVIARNGRVVWLEVKRPGEKPTAEQAATHAWLSDGGHAVYVVTSAQQAIDVVAAEMRQKASAA